MLEILLIGFIGLFVGSFLNVVVERMHAGRDFVHGRSECDNCHHALGAGELAPVASFLLLKGRCKHCHKPISPQSTYMELTTGVAFGLSVWTHPPISPLSVVELLLWLAVISALMVLALYDLKWYLLPDKILLPIIGPALLLAVIGVIGNGHWSMLLHPLLAALFFGGVFYAIAAASKGAWMGGGDIKLAFVMGLLLGAQKTTLAMLIAFNSAAVIGVLLIALKKKSRKDLIPFGPFLIFGTLIAYWFGTPIIDWYFKISGLNLLY